ncbi:MAG: hypothetical protein Kow0098_28160 [Ignavibacteriaceae bacterium]
MKTLSLSILKAKQLMLKLIERIEMSQVLLFTSLKYLRSNSAHNQPINPTAFSHLGFLKILGWLFGYKFVVLISSIK